MSTRWSIALIIAFSVVQWTAIAWGAWELLAHDVCQMPRITTHTQSLRGCQ